MFKVERSPTVYRNVMSNDTLLIEGARQNNLKNLTLALPHNRLIVVTGLSGSGKSSLAFDTIFAEGQWRYIESLSTYARMFLEKVSRPDVDAIHHIRPAIAIERKNPVRTARSTVGTGTEIYDYLRLLFAKVGRTYCPRCGREVRARSVEDLAEGLLQAHAGAPALILFSFPLPKNTPLPEVWAELQRKGYARIAAGGEVVHLTPDYRLPRRAKEVRIIQDRLTLKPEQRGRLTEAIEAALKAGEGTALAEVEGQTIPLGRAFRCYPCDLALEPPQPLLFSFNHPLGACPECKGFGNILEYDEDRVIPNKNLSLAQGAIDPWTKPAYREWQEEFLPQARRWGIDMQKPYRDLSEQERERIWKGKDGIADFFAWLEGKRYKLHVRVFLSRYKGAVVCPRCGGTRLRPEALAVRVGGFHIHQASELPITEAARWLQGLSLTTMEQEIAKEVLRQIEQKLGYLLRVGLGYLTLSRQTRTLSGGEAQRINLANQLGSQLTGTLYVLDEPSIGLHARDTARLTAILRDLVALGNTAIVVEHDRSVIESADHVVEMGPGSGARGGEVVFSGPQAEFSRSDCLTARYLRDEERIAVPDLRRKGSGHALLLLGAREHNLKGIDLAVPLRTFTCITGVSGSGKSTLLYDTLYRALARIFRIGYERMGQFDRIAGAEHLRSVRLIDQEPIGRTPRSNPVTYLKAFEEIRKLLGSQPTAKALGLTASQFSFNIPGGRCEACKGEGYQKLEMYFFEDLYVPCEECEGKRFKPEVLAVSYRGRNIHQILELTVAEALPLFREVSPLRQKLELLDAVGLGYLRLGQPAPTLSGGEAQRLKICAELDDPEARDLLYLLDEPTTGLHFDDIRKLLGVLHRLVEQGNTVVVIEHNLDVIKTADWIIDLGPEAGEDGGEMVAQGTPEEVTRVKRSHTGRYLRKALDLDA